MAQLLRTRLQRNPYHVGRDVSVKVFPCVIRGEQLVRIESSTAKMEIQPDFVPMVFAKTLYRFFDSGRDVALLENFLRACDYIMFPGSSKFRHGAMVWQTHGPTPFKIEWNCEKREIEYKKGDLIVSFLETEIDEVLFEMFTSYMQIAEKQDGMENPMFGIIPFFKFRLKHPDYRCEADPGELYGAY